MTYIAEKIEYAIKLRGTSAYKMCQATGLSQSTYSDIKNKNRDPRYLTIKLIAEYLELDLATLEPVERGEK